MLNVPVVMLVAAAAVLIGVVYVATGRGGELAFFQPDYAPLKLDQVTSTDVALFRPPTALWGYSMQATDEALSRIAGAITERDIEISALQQKVTDLEAAAAKQRAHAPPQASSGPDELNDPDIVLPDRVMPRDEPRRPSRTERDERGKPPAAAAQNGMEDPATRPVTQGTRPAAGGPDPGEAGAPPTSSWFGRAADRTPSSPGWATLPKRPPTADEGDGSQ
jgi:hypothetical protein